LETNSESIAGRTLVSTAARTIRVAGWSCYYESATGND